MFRGHKYGTWAHHFVNEFVNLDKFDSGKEIEDPFTNNIERVRIKKIKLSIIEKL